MTETLFAAFYLFAPAFVANGMPVVLKNMPGLKAWKTPVYAPWFGKNKTWRGIIGGTAFAVLVAWLQFFYAPLYYPFELTEQDALLIGLLLGLGVQAGDLVESAVKRAMGMPPGAPLPFWDGIDYMVGAIIFLAPFYIPGVLEIAVLILVAPVASLLANITSYFLGWKNVWH